jgi:hypothetical protein
MSDERQHGNSQQRETSTHGASALKPAPVDAPDPAPSTPRGMVQDRAGIVGEPIHAHSKHGFAVQGQIRRTRERNLEPGAGRGSVCSPTTPKTATASRGRDRVLSSPSRGSGTPGNKPRGAAICLFGNFFVFSGKADDRQDGHTRGGSKAYPVRNCSRLGVGPWEKHWRKKVFSRGPTCPNSQPPGRGTLSGHAG